MLWACAVLQYRPERALAAIGAAFGDAAAQTLGSSSAPQPQAPHPDPSEEAALAALPEGFCTQDLANLAWSLALLDAFALPLFTSVWRVAAALPPGAYAQEGLRMLFQTVLLLGAQDAEGGGGAAASAAAAAAAAARPRLNPALAAATEASWRAQVPEHTVSELHGDVCRALAALRVPHSVEQPSDDGLFSIDVAIVDAPSSARVALEVDGPFHFTANSRAALGPTRSRNRLLAARGWRVVCVPFFEWNALRNVYEQKLYLKAKLKAAGVDADALAARAAADGPRPWAASAQPSGAEGDLLPGAALVGYGAEEEGGVSA